MIVDKPIDELTAAEVIEALNSNPITSANSLEESVEELKAMGIRDINSVDVPKAMSEALKNNVQVQKTLQDITRNSTDKRSIREYLEHHIEFLASISNKSKKDIVNLMTLDQAQAALKITAKMNDVPDEIIKKHLKTLRKKFN